MGILNKAGWLADIIRWRFRWDRRDLEHVPEGDVSGKFVSGRDAAARIPDGATVLSCGMAGNARCSAFFWAVAEQHARRGHPRDLTWISVGAQGGRGKAPGTVEELARRGLLTRYVSGHVETAKSLLALAEVVDRLMPGIDVERDVLAHATARIHLPESVPRVPPSVLTGRGFELHWSGTV